MSWRIAIPWLLTAGLMLGGNPVRAENHAALVAGAQREAQLNIADAAPGENFTKFLAAFKAKYPFLDLATGFYSAPTGRVLARVNAELDAKHVTFDVMLAANMAAFVKMTRAGKLQRYDSPEYAAYPPNAKQDGYWAAVQAIGVIMAYNENRLSANDAPHAWADLLLPRFANRQIALQNAASGTQFNQIYLLQQALGLDYLKKLGAQRPVVMATSAQVTDAVIRGEVLIGATLDHWRAFEPAAAKAGLRPIYPAEGMPLTLAPVGIVAGAPHPNAAKLFMDFILSQEGQTLLDTKLYGMYSMRPDVPPPPGQKPLAETKPLLPTNLDDYLRASAQFPAEFDSLFH
ncbi:MAG TPA: extracellular solute-binding protein [Alphaproteobacteria bacterium]|nr:extracellular solute-binding protein [Alphaproteobacteria bacterium]